MTLEARAAIAAADEVLYLVPDPVSASGIEALNPSARSLHGLYEDGVSHRDAYERMAEAILEPVRAGKRVCAAFYGHPGVFVLPSHDAIARARAEGFDATMLPGVSAEDCLVADLGVDPARNGLQSYEAGDFLRRRPVIEPTTALVLWQIGVVGARRLSASVTAPALGDLVEPLARAVPGRPRSRGLRSIVLSRSRALHRETFGWTSSARLLSPPRQRCTCRQFLAERPRPPRGNDVSFRLEELLRTDRGITSFLRLAGGRVRLRESEQRLGCEHRRVGGAGELDGGGSEVLRLPAAAELGECLRASDTPRDLRMDVVGRGRPLARERGGQRLLGTALRVQSLRELGGDRSKIRALADLLELLERRTELSFRCAGISGKQLDCARPRRDRCSADAAAEGIEDLLPFPTARARIVELAGHRGQ